MEERPNPGKRDDERVLTISQSISFPRFDMVSSAFHLIIRTIERSQSQSIQREMESSIAAICLSDRQIYFNALP
jgi:hypothetical protein